MRIKSQELEVKNAAANDKLKKMVKDQQEAEKKKVCVSGALACWAYAGSLWERRKSSLGGLQGLTGWDGGVWVG